MRRVFVGGIALALTTAFAVADPAKPSSVPEPAGYWTGPMHGTTPDRVAGASIIDAAGLAKLKQDSAPVMIDVANMDRKPRSFPSNMIWDPRHLSIPGATWMPGAGSGRTDAGFETAFDKRLATLTGGDKTKPVVTFCHPQRWGSYNAAKRAAALGYRRVYWMPSGAEGWQDSNKASVVHEDPDWRTSLSNLPPDPTGLRQN